MLHTLRFSLQNAVYFIMLPFLVHVGNIEIDSNTVKQGIMRMKNGRAAGPGDIPIEL